MAPLPDASLTLPHLVIAPPRDAKPAGDISGSLLNVRELV